MISLIEYLVMFLIVSVLSPGGVASIVYITISILSYSIWGIFYYVESKKNELKKSRYEFNANTYLIMIAIIMVNMVHKMPLINLMFGFTYLLLFNINFIIRLVKKDSITSKSPIKSSHLFDLYSILYLSGLVMEILKNEL